MKTWSMRKPGTRAAFQWLDDFIFLFCVVEKKAGFDELNDGGVFDGGIEVAHDEVGIILLLPGFEFLQDQGA